MLPSQNITPVINKNKILIYLNLKLVRLAPALVSVLHDDVIFVVIVIFSPPRGQFGHEGRGSLEYNIATRFLQIVHS